MRFEAAPGATELGFAGYRYGTVDDTFIIARRTD
jgi:hypothetical protein